MAPALFWRATPLKDMDLEVDGSLTEPENRPVDGVKVIFKALLLRFVTRLSLLMEIWFTMSADKLPPDKVSVAVPEFRMLPPRAGGW